MSDRASIDPVANSHPQFASKGFNYGFVEFDDPGAAERAMQTLNGRRIHQSVRSSISPFRAVGHFFVFLELLCCRVARTTSCQLMHLRMYSVAVVAIAACVTSHSLECIDCHTSGPIIWIM